MSVQEKKLFQIISTTLTVTLTEAGLTRNKLKRTDVWLCFCVKYLFMTIALRAELLPFNPYVCGGVGSASPRGRGLWSGDL